MNNILKQKLEHEALKAERKQEIEYWDREYSGDIELGRAKLRIKELEQELNAHNQLKSISWNLNRIANVLEGDPVGRKLRKTLNDKIENFDADEVGFARAMRRHLGGKSDA